MARLRLFRNGKFVRSRPLGAHPFFVGRDPISYLRLEEPACSRQHFCLTEQEDGYLLEDLQSANGTFVDGVREYRRVLKGQAVIQVGEDLLLFEPDEDDTTDEVPEWALKSAASISLIKEDDGMRTAPMVPTIQRKVQAAARAQTRPHLVTVEGDSPSVFPLDTQIVTVGFGPVRVSLGPSKKGKEEVLAEIVHETGYDYRVRAKGLFGKVVVNGKPQGRARLQPGDVLTIGGVKLEFRLGLDEGDG